MMKLMKVALISAFMATSGFANQAEFLAEALDLDGVDIKAGHTMKINVSDIPSENILYNGGIIQKVANPDDSTATTATITTDKTSATIYNFYNAEEDANRLESTIAGSGKTFAERVTELMENDAAVDPKSAYTPTDVYTVLEGGKVVTDGDYAVTLDNVTADRAGLLESLRIMQLNDTTKTDIEGDHRVFNIVYPASVSDSAKPYVYYAGPKISQQDYINIAGCAVVSIPNVGQSTANMVFNHSFSLAQFRGLTTKSYITKDCSGNEYNPGQNVTGANFTGQDIVMQGAFEALDEANSVTFDGQGYEGTGTADDPAGTPAKVIFAGEVDMSKATTTTFQRGTFVFRKKLTI